MCNGDRTHFFHAAREADLIAVIVDLADRRNNRRRTAQAAFSKVLDLIEINFTLFYLKAEIFLSNDHQGTSGDRRQNAVGFRGNDLVILRNKEEVSAAGFFNLRSGAGIEVHILVKALFMSGNDGMKAHSVVQTSLDKAGAVRSGSVEIADLNGNRLSAALEVRANGGAEDTELEFVCRFYADNGVNTEHEGTEIQGSAGAIGGNVCFVGTNNLFYSLDEFILGEHGHFHTAGRISQTFRIEVRTEYNGIALFGSIGFQTFKDRLCILEYAGTFAHIDHIVINESALIPGTVFEGGNITFVSFDVAKAQA